MLDGHDDKVCASGGGVLHIDDGVSCACDDACTHSGEQAASAVYGKQRGNIVDHHRRDNHTAQGAQEKYASQQAVTQDSHRNIQNNGGNTDGKIKQTVQDYGNTRKTGHGKLGVEGKVVNPDGNQKASQKLHKNVCKGQFLKCEIIVILLFYSLLTTVLFFHS